MREKPEEAFTELKYCQNGMLRLVKVIKIDSKDVSVSVEYYNQISTYGINGCS